MLDFQRTKDPKAIEEIVAKPMEGLIKYSMDKDQVLLMVTLLKASDVGVEALLNNVKKDAAGPAVMFLFNVLEKRLNILPFSMDLRSRMFFSFSGVWQTPGELVLYLAYFAYKTYQEKVPIISLKDHICERWFAFGFWKRKDLQSIWEAQKVAGPHGSVNLLDYGTAYGSMIESAAKVG